MTLFQIKSATKEHMFKIPRLQKEDSLSRVMMTEAMETLSLPQYKHKNKDSFINLVHIDLFRLRDCILIFFGRPMRHRGMCPTGDWRVLANSCHIDLGGASSQACASSVHSEALRSGFASAITKPCESWGPCHSSVWSFTWRWSLSVLSPPWLCQECSVLCVCSVTVHSPWNYPSCAVYRVSENQTGKVRFFFT